MKFTAVGDMLIQRRFPQNYEGFSEVKDYISKGDFRFCNLETTVTDGKGCFGSQISGGSWLRTDPDNLDYLEKYGFNAINCANNHAMDFSYNGLFDTIDNLKDRGYEAAGIGENMGRASAPVYIDTPNGRAALISMFVLEDQTTAMAGEQSRRFIGRPGVNGLRVSKYFVVKSEQIKMLRQLAADTDANVNMEILRSEGYRPQLPDGVVEFASLLFKEGDTPNIEYILNPKDMERIKKSIHEAKLQADYIYVSLHDHAAQGRKDVPLPYCEEFARKCIDYGADGVIGHGPHLLRGIEIYKNRPIFYSLGDFILQNENIPFAPEDFFDKYDLKSDSTMHELFDKRSNHFTRGLSVQKVMFETIIPFWEINDGKMTSLELMPVLLKFDSPRSRYGMPQISKSSDIIERLAELSKPYGTDIKIKDGVGHIILK